MVKLQGNITGNQPALKGDIQENQSDMGADIPAKLVIGIPGKSAYQYALEAGYTGTEAEFAEALAQIGDTPIDEDAVIRIVEAYLAEHPSVTEETDPTVPDWAKQPEPPTYTAQDVGALPADTQIPTKTSQLVNDSGFLTEHQDISGKLDASALPEAIDDALAAAKASGEFKGDTGATGPQGPQGPKGDTGPQGPAYTLTSQDKAAIVNAVIAELPVYNGEAVDE